MDISAAGPYLVKRIHIHVYCVDVQWVMTVVIMINYSLTMSCLWYTLKQVMKKYGLSMLPITSSNVQSMAVELGAPFQEK